jgi:hypothetical protein
LQAFHEAADRALKSLASRFPEAQGFSVKLRHKNLPAFAPAYYIGTLDRIEVRHGWTFGLNALLDATGKPLAALLGLAPSTFGLSALLDPPTKGVRETKLVVVRASRLQSLVEAVSLLVFCLAACAGSAIAAPGFVSLGKWYFGWVFGDHFDWSTVMLRLFPGILVTALIVVLVTGLLALLARLTWMLRTWVVGAFLHFSGNGISPEQLRQAFKAIGDEIQQVMNQRSSAGDAAWTSPVSLAEPAMTIPTRYSMDYTSKLLPLVREYTCTMAGAVVKLVYCDSCGAGYAYRMNRSVQEVEGSSFFLHNAEAEAGAASKAEAQLRGTLERSVDPVPCPACGWYQQNMLRSARREHRLGMLYTGLGLTIGVIAVALIGVVINALAGPPGYPVISWHIFWGVLIAMGIPGIGLMAAKLVLAACYDPNTEDVETRKQIGQARVIPREEFEEMILAQRKDKPEKGGGA